MKNDWDLMIEERVKEMLMAMERAIFSNIWFRGKALVDKNIPAMIILRKIVPFWRKAAESRWWIGRKYWNFRADREAGKCLN